MSEPYPRRLPYLVQKDIEKMPTQDGYGFFQSDYEGVVDFLVGILKYSSRELTEICLIVSRIDSLSGATDKTSIDRRDKMSRRAVFLYNRLKETVDSTSVSRIFPVINIALDDPEVTARTISRKSFDGYGCVESPISVPTDGQAAVALLESEIDAIVQDADDLLFTVGL